MAGSAAEERIRVKAEAAMRRRWPGARIVHELQLEQGGIRIDLAAIGEDFLALAEIKSERDVLKRLRSQIGRAMDVADEVWIVVAEKHEAAIAEIRRSYGEPHTEAEATRRAIQGARTMVERLGLDGGLHLDTWSMRDRPNTPDPRCRFDLLWRDEMASALGRHFGGAAIAVSSKMTRSYMTGLAIEHMTGRELRRAVCAQLRDRTFPRADPRASLMPEPSKPDLYRRPEPQAEAVVDPAWQEEPKA